MKSGPATAASICTLCFGFACLTISILDQKKTPVIWGQFKQGFSSS
jgi:hypothetical protein